MSAVASDLVLFGSTRKGRTFRPSDWNERLAGLTSAFGADRKLVYSPLVKPMTIGGVRVLVVGHALAELEPRLWEFMLHFARDNDLVVDRVEDALADPAGIAPPVRAARTEPQEPV
jgi:hypothetical protein